MPRAGLTMVEGTISTWKVPEGASVQKGDVLMEYENEKSIQECEALNSGILHILAQEGDTVAVGAPIAVLAADQQEYDSLANGGAAAATAVSTAAPAAPTVSAAPAAVKTPVVTGGKAVMSDGHIRATGLARKMAKEAGVSLADIAPTGGPDGLRIVAKDVEAYLSAPKATPAVSTALEDEITEIPWTGIRKTIARNMFNSLQTTAQNTCTVKCDVTDLLALREKFVADQEQLGCKITVNDLLCKMLGKVVAKHPFANATFDGKTLYSHKHVHLSVAVATEDGLMVPVVRNIDTLTLTEINAQIKTLAQRAKDKQLTADEQSGGTFTITNVGMFPIDLATPVINLPQTCICGFGRPRLEPAVLPDGTIGPRQMMNVFLTFDHQVIDGLECGRIFQDIQYHLEHPEMILA
jgi:pyruvate/2-oxoglutarate dehydrogenase complex dihydrolipoamide acyltransferase (E2) component